MKDDSVFGSRLDLTVSVIEIFSKGWLKFWLTYWIFFFRLNLILIEEEVAVEDFKLQFRTLSVSINKIWWWWWWWWVVFKINFLFFLMSRQIIFLSSLFLISSKLSQMDLQDSQLLYQRIRYYKCRKFGIVLWYKIRILLFISFQKIPNIDLSIFEEFIFDKG